MKVCVITTAHSIFADSRVFFRMAQGLVSRGDEVVLIAPTDSHGKVGGVDLVPLRQPRNRLHRLWLQVSVFKHAMSARYDVYHLHDPELLLLGGILGLLGRKVVIDFHENIKADILRKHYLPRALRGMVRRLYATAERVFLRSVSGVVLAEDSYETMYDWFSPRVVIRNYPMTRVMPHRFPRAPKQDEPVQLAYIGTISRDRGIFDLVMALAEVRKRRSAGGILHLMGPENSRDEAKALRQLIRENGLDEAVRIHGNHPYPEVFALLASCHVGLAVLQGTANYVESMPTKLLEYMLAGLPVVASDFPINCKYIEPPQVGLVVRPGNPEAIASAVIEIISDEDRFLGMAREGQTRVRSRFSWEVELGRLRDFYVGIVSASG